MKALHDELHELVEQNAGLAWDVALRWRRSGLDVDDLAQVGMIGLMKAARGYDPERGAFSTYATYWIRASIARAAEKLLKHAGLYSLDALERDETPDDAEGPDDELISAEQSAKVWAAVDRLDAKDREVIRARYWDGASQSQVGERMGTTRTRVYQRERRAIDRLGELLAAV